MAPKEVPSPLQCSVPNCGFSTNAGCPTWDLMVNILAQHTQSVHGGAPATQPSHTSRLEKLPRPTSSLQMTKSQWQFKKIQWNHYINQSTVPEATKLTQLQAACDESLRQRVFDTGLYNTLTSEKLFLDNHHSSGSPVIARQVS